MTRSMNTQHVTVHILLNKRHLNSSHIQEHLRDLANVSIEDMSEEELQFHYFKLHDYDNNNYLDGLELVAALTHFDDVKPVKFLMELVIILEDYIKVAYTAGARLGHICSSVPDAVRMYYCT